MRQSLLYFTLFPIAFTLQSSKYIKSSLASVRALSTSNVKTCKMAVNRGAFILFEGIDRCGKTTQCGLLTSYMSSSESDSTKSNLKTEAIRFPNRTSTIGIMINDYLTNTKNTINDHTIHLLFSANRWEASTELENKLLSGCNLICDRYAYSGVAFSSAKGMDLEWCKACDKGLPAPDV